MNKKIFLVFVAIAFAISFVSATKISARAEDGFVSIEDEDFEGKSRAYLKLTEKDGVCHGTLSINFRGESEDSKASLRIRKKLRGIECDVDDDKVFLAGKADIKYRTTQKQKKVFDEVTELGYSKWKWVKTGTARKFDDDEHIILMLIDGELNIYSENFGVYQMDVTRFRVR